MYEPFRDQGSNALRGKLGRAEKFVQERKLYWKETAFDNDLKNVNVEKPDNKKFNSCPPELYCNQASQQHCFYMFAKSDLTDLTVFTHSWMASLLKINNREPLVLCNRDLGLLKCVWACTRRALVVTSLHRVYYNDVGYYRLQRPMDREFLLITGCEAKQNHWHVIPCKDALIGIEERAPEVQGFEFVVNLHFIFYIFD